MIKKGYSRAVNAGGYKRLQKLYKQAEALDADSGAGDGARPTLPPLHANAQRRSIVGLPGISATSAGAHVYTARHEGDGGSSTALISEATVKRVSSGGSQSDLSSNLGPADLNALLQSGNNNGPGELMNSGAAGAGGAGASSGAASAAANGTVDGEIEISTIVSKGEGSEMAAAADDNNPDNEITPVRSAATAIATRNPKTKQVAVESTTTASTVSEHVDNAGGKDGQEDSPSKPLKLAKSKMKRGLTKFHYMKMMIESKGRHSQCWQSYTRLVQQRGRCSQDWRRQPQQQQQQRRSRQEQQWLQ